MKRSCDLICLFLVFVTLFLIDGGVCRGEGGSDVFEQIEQDTDGDGRVDRVIVLCGEGQPVKISGDTDGDGRFDTFQYYADGVVGRIERDMDADGIIDGRDVFESGQRVRHETIAVTGNVVGVQRFDENDMMIEWRQDTNGDGNLDTICRYNAGGLESMTTDTNGDGEMDAVQTYRDDGTLARQRRDTDGDSIMDMTTEMVAGAPAVVTRDTDADGRADIRHSYEDGRLVSTWRDDDGDGWFDIRISFEEEGQRQVVECVNPDGQLLSIRTYKNGVLREYRQMDAVAGLPVLLEIYDENGRIETSREATETSGKFNLAWYYDETGTVIRAESDRNTDGRVDIWYHYRDGVAVRIEEDRDRDGKPDLWEVYGADERLLSRKEDLDFDGAADIEETF